jgi:hypothetical protein
VTLTDVLINTAAPIGTLAIATVNTFLQTWDPPTKGLRASRLGSNTIRMLKMARKYKTNLGALHLPTRVKIMMPAWYHPGVANCPMMNVAAKCLLKRHQTRTVADLVKRMNKLRDPQRVRNHTPTPTCSCRNCIQDRREGCRNLQECANEALTRLQDIAPKFNPLALLHQENHGFSFHALSAFFTCHK